MAPAQILDLPQTQTSYTHKKFQGKRYAHKKFGTRSPLPTTAHRQTEYEIIDNTSSKENEAEIQPTVMTARDPLPSKRSVGDIFRPYALEESTSRKRKHQEIQEEYQPQQMNSYNINSKRFAPSPMVSPVFLAPAASQTNHLQSNVTPAPPPYYIMQQFHFNSQTFALILQKQQAALCMGEILKQQQNFNLHNLMGK